MTALTRNGSGRRWQEQGGVLNSALRIWFSGTQANLLAGLGPHQALRAQS
jgi:hypothetical protein